MRYRVEELKERAIPEWLDAAQKCAYAPFNAFDVELLRSQLRKPGRSLNLLVRNASDGEIAALFPCEMDTKRAGPFNIRIARTRFFGGLLITDGYSRDSGRIRSDFIEMAVKGLLAKAGTDIAEVKPPPLLVIEKPSFIYNIMPFDEFSTEKNTVLYTDMKGDFIQRLGKTVRYETNKGIENLKKSEMAGKEDGRAPAFLKMLEEQKAGALNIEKLPEEEIARVIGSGQLTTLIAVREGRPLAAVTYSCRGKVATLHYNASSPDGKKLFLNKALLYTCMMESKSRGAEYFLLGNGREQAASAREKCQLEKLAYFKRSFSTDEAETYRFIAPLTVKGAAAAALNRAWKRRLR